MRFCLCMHKHEGYKPPVPSELRPCKRCGAPCWISEPTREYLDDPENADVQISCITCAPIAEAEAMARDGYLKTGLAVKAVPGALEQIEALFEQWRKN